jgi:serine/threonine protein kinase
MLCVDSKFWINTIMAYLSHTSAFFFTGADDNFVYMLMGLVQGGELYSRMHTKTRDKVPENETVFYVAGIHEGLSYMHRRGFVYRDLKPGTSTG